MKRTILLFATLVAFTALQAQWVNDPQNNTFIANTSADAGEIHIATNAITGDTYMQWCSFVGGNGWSPTLQRLNAEGVPQWGLNGLHISAHQFSSSSEGIAMATTTDGGVVSCFAIYDGYTYAMKINADGTFAWGEQGVRLFGGLGFSRTEVIADNNNGVWALGFDYTNLYLQHVNADGTMNPTVTISDNGGQRCMYGQLTLSNENRVFVTYEKCGNGFYTDKEIYVAGYNPDGTPYSPETLLMSSQTGQVTYLHHALPDGMGGGYVYIWHSGLGSFNTYVFHFDSFGASTISSTIGTPVHTYDPSYYFIDAYATVDPVSHDILLAYRQTDASYEREYKLLVNRISPYGDLMWGEGILVLDNDFTPFGGTRIDAFEYGYGFSVIYNNAISPSSDASTVEAKGFTMDGDLTWETTLCSNTYPRTRCENTSGFHNGQNIVAWINSTGAVTGGGSGGLYGQNIGSKGEMGEITPPTPPAPCLAPTNFSGEYYYSDEMFGAMVSWNAPETTPHHYNLYREGFKEVIEIDPEYTSYFEEIGIGDYVYRLTAVYEDCESNYALTESGDDYVFITVTGVPENTDEEIVTVTKVYTLSGQLIRNANLEELSRGVYIVQGLTKDGKLINKKTVVNP